MDLLELESLLHIYTNIVYIFKLSFNLFTYFSRKRSKCFLPLAAVLGSSVLPQPASKAMPFRESLSLKQSWDFVALKNM